MFHSMFSFERWFHFKELKEIHFLLNSNSRLL